MAKANRVLTRVGIGDILLTSKETENLQVFIKYVDKEGELVEEFVADTFLVGYEDEDGNECHEDGEYLN